MAAEVVTSPAYAHTTAAGNPCLTSLHATDDVLVRCHVRLSPDIPCHVGTRGTRCRTRRRLIVVDPHRRTLTRKLCQVALCRRTIEGLLRLMLIVEHRVPTTVVSVLSVCPSCQSRALVLVRQSPLVPCSLVLLGDTRHAASMSERGNGGVHYVSLPASGGDGHLPLPCIPCPPASKHQLDPMGRTGRFRWRQGGGRPVVVYATAGMHLGAEQSPPLGRNKRFLPCFGGGETSRDEASRRACIRGRRRPSSSSLLLRPGRSDRRCRDASSS